MGVGKMKLKNRVALVTGASSGIGQASAVALAQEGAVIVVTGRNQARLAETTGMIQEAGGQCLQISADLLDQGHIDRLVGEAKAKLGRLDILVNSAGVFETADFTQVSEEFYDRTMDANLKGLFFITQRVVKEMKEAGGGKIISLSSIGGGTVGFPTGSVYCASKAAIAALTQTLAVELAPFKINVNCICPGNVLTPMNQELFENKDYEAAMLALTPWQRIGRTEDITPAVVYLASQQSDYVTGIKLVIDGGWSCP